MVWFDYLEVLDHLDLGKPDLSYLNHDLIEIIYLFIICSIMFNSEASLRRRIDDCIDRTVRMEIINIRTVYFLFKQCFITSTILMNIVMVAFKFLFSILSSLLLQKALAIGPPG